MSKTTTETKPEKLVIDEKGRINLSDIYGVDIYSDKGVQPHPDFRNPKTTIRSEVVDNICDNITSGKIADWQNLPPIEVYQKDGKWHIVNGYHRVSGILKYRQADRGNTRFNQVRAVEYIGTPASAELYAFKVNLVDSSMQTGLTDAEIFAFIKNFVDNNKKCTKEDFRHKLGVSKRLSNQLDIILDGASEETIKAVIDGDVSIDTAAKAVTKSGDKEKQTTAVRLVKALKNMGSSEKEAREIAGIRQHRSTTMFTKQEFFDYVEEVFDNIDEGLNPDYWRGQLDALKVVIKSEDLDDTEFRELISNKEKS